MSSPKKQKISKNYYEEDSEVETARNSRIAVTLTSPGTARDLLTSSRILCATKVVCASSNLPGSITTLSSLPASKAYASSTPSYFFAISSISLSLFVYSSTSSYLAPGLDPEIASAI